MKDHNHKILLDIEGMTCTNCALGVTRTLENNGCDNVNVNFVTGEASFTTKEHNNIPVVIDRINKLGYKAKERTHDDHHGHNHDHNDHGGMSSIEKKFYFSLIFTVPLFCHMFLPIELLHHPLVQLILCIPVMIIGMNHFGRSAWGSIKSGVPNMDVLITIGTLAAFVYSIAGTVMFWGTDMIHHYLFYETAATIISLVLLGNVLEHRSVMQTTTAISDLSKVQASTAKRIKKGLGIGDLGVSTSLNMTEIRENEPEETEEVAYNDIKVNDILLVNHGDKVPVDGEIISGSASVDEAMISGESAAVDKNKGDKVIGGTVVVQGNFRMKATSVGSETVLAQIIDMVKNAQQSKPAIQKLGDQVSAVFVPVVLSISLLTFLVAHFVFHVSVQQSLMNSIAVLVISCPCAMGLATPTAVMVGIGRAAKSGILIKGGSTLEAFAGIKKVVFDKTGTLTTGEFTLKKIIPLDGTSEQEIINLLYELEKHSSHPIAKSLVKELSGKAGNMVLSDVQEQKGIGISAKNEAGDSFYAGSYFIASALTNDNSHILYLLKNNVLIAFVDMDDSIMPNALETINFLNSQNIETIMLSGDRKEKCEEIARKLNIKTVFSEKHPAEKLKLIEQLVKESPVAMVGDGINDAPALTRASVGISLSNATQVAIQSAQIILLNKDGLMQFNNSYLLSKHTLITIKQNLFWAFFYNVVAIPLAAMGFLSPMLGALAMAFSDVVVVGNSLRLKRKKLGYKV